MSALAEARPVGRERPSVGVDHGVAFLALRVVLAALYAGYVIVQVPAVIVPALAIMAGLAAVLVFDGPRRAAWCACAVVVLAVLHARVLGSDAPFVPIQLGLAAFAVGSATLSLIAAPAGVRLSWVLVAAGGIGLLVGAPAGAVEAVAGLAGGLLAGMRPLSALAVIVSGRSAGREVDGWLAWTPIVHAPGGR